MPRRQLLPFENDPTSSLTATRPEYQLYALYYVSDETTLFDWQKAAQRWKQDQERSFWRVAVLEARDLSHVYELSYANDQPWVQREQVRWAASSHLRSAAVGDVIVLLTSGQSWIIAPFDFYELTSP